MEYLVLQLADLETESNLDVLVTRVEALRNEMGGKIEMVIGFDECLFQGRTLAEGKPVEGAVEDAVVRHVIGGLLSSGTVTAEKLMPKWLIDLLRENKGLPKMPENYDEMMGLFGVIYFGVVGIEVIKNAISGWVEKICDLDRMIMEWVKAFFRAGITMEYFVERARWLDGVSPDTLAVTINGMQSKLPALREEVLRIVERLAQIEGVEIHMITGTVREVVLPVLSLHEGLMGRLKLTEDRVYASERGFDDGKMSYVGAKAMHPGARVKKVNDLGKNLKVTVLAERNTLVEARDSIVKAVEENGGVVVAIGTRKLEN